VDEWTGLGEAVGLAAAVVVAPVLAWAAIVRARAHCQAKRDRRDRAAIDWCLIMTSAAACV
jgi:hypothetical protein